MSYRVTVLLVVGAVVSLTLGVAAVEFIQASPAAAVSDEPRDGLQMLVQFALLYGAVICVGGAMDCFFARRSSASPETEEWPKDLSDDEVSHGPDGGTAHES